MRNAAVGIQSYNGAPQIDTFTANGNTVGLATYGGMSLPTIYRSTALSGQSAGWTTYKLDLSTYLGTGNYLQVGANSIYGGGNAHPYYNYYWSKYYWVSDRMNIMFEDDNGNTWNITDDGQEGYYPYGSDDPAVVAGTHSYNGGSGGAPSWHCNYYGFSYGPNYQSSEGSFSVFYRNWLGQVFRGQRHVLRLLNSDLAGKPSPMFLQPEPGNRDTRTSTGHRTPQQADLVASTVHQKDPTDSQSPVLDNQELSETHRVIHRVVTTTTTVFVLTTPTPPT